MKVLANIFKVKGQKDYYYKQLKREGLVVMSEMIAERDDKTIGYEVFIVQQYPERKSPDGLTTIEAREACPPSETWGNKGWSYNSTESGKFEAEARFWEIVNIMSEDVGISEKTGKKNKRRQPNHFAPVAEYKEFLKQNNK